MADNLDMFVGGMAGGSEDVETTETVVTTTTTETAAPKESEAAQPRDESGKFTTKEVKEPEVPKEPAATEPEKKPLTASEVQAIIEERHRRQKAEEKAELAERRLREIEDRQRSQAKIPTFQDDPEAYAQYQQQQREMDKAEIRFEQSEVMAREKHGDALVTEVMEWAVQKGAEEKARLGISPFATEYFRQKHPVDWAVKQHKREIAQREIGDDLDAYKAKIIAEHIAANAAPQTAAQPVTAVPPTTPAQPRPPRSLASTPNAGATPQQETPDNPLDLLTPENLRKRNG